MSYRLSLLKTVFVQKSCNDLQMDTVTLLEHYHMSR
jgi:hypothetical protein